MPSPLSLPMQSLVPLLLMAACVFGVVPSASLASGAEEQLSSVPDPFGLGERLALIDWLHEHGHETAPGIELAELRTLYASAASAARAASEATVASDPQADHQAVHRADAQPSAQSAATADPAATADREAAALELWRQHGENPAAGSDAQTIRARIAELDTKRGKADASERERQGDDDATLSSKPRAAGDKRPSLKPGPAERKPADAAHPAAATAALAKPPAKPAEIREVAHPKDMGDETRAYVISPDSSPILIVVCDASLRGVMEPILARWPAAERLAAGVDGTVIIHGHSDGGNFNDGVLKQTGAIGGDLAEHLRRNREFYETLGGTRERRPLDMAVMTGCNAGGFNQERELKDGLGYRPLHRVFTTPECLDCAATCLPAIMAAGSTTFDFAKPWRAKYTLFEKLVAHGDKKYAVSSYSAVDQNAFDVHDQMHRFIVADTGIHEEP